MVQVLEGSSNASEATVALNVVRSLLGHLLPSPRTGREQGGLSKLHFSIHSKEIVVMSPFRAQVNHCAQDIS